jgi:hypothetical protein
MSEKGLAQRHHFDRLKVHEDKGTKKEEAAEILSQNPGA